MLSSSQQYEVRQYLGDDCDGDTDEAARKIEKRKPNFIRFGRAGARNFRKENAKHYEINSQYFLLNNGVFSASSIYGRKDVDPNFLQFGRSSSAFIPNEQNYLRMDTSFVAHATAFFTQLSSVQWEQAAALNM
uniref:Uncharacterized protein n=1 Tax=Setaria digitata TaxID=48799 RepID=A0A915PFS9_9BILA